MLKVTFKTFEANALEMCLSHQVTLTSEREMYFWAFWVGTHSLRGHFER